MNNRKILTALLAVSAMLVAAGCISGSAAWSFTLDGNASMTVNQALYERLINCNQTYDGITGIPLEFFLNYYGLYPVTALTVDNKTYNWTAVALDADWDEGMLVTDNGSIYYRGQLARPGNMQVRTAEKPAVTTLDVAPSVLYALGAGTDRPGLIPNRTRQVVLVYIDAFGYQRYRNAVSDGLVANISALGEPIRALCAYPSVSENNAKAMLTGRPPDLAAGDFRSRFPSSETVLQIVARQGMSAVWVDGGSATVKVDSSIVRSDINKNGTADDEAMDAAIAQYRVGANLVVVHLGSTDTAMHRYGPYSAEGEASVRLADALIGRLTEAMEPGSVLVVWADHGCHTSTDGGNHGTLLPDDMYVPIFVHAFGQPAPNVFTIYTQL